MQTSTNLFVDNRWDTSATSEGTIKYLREGSTTTAAICVKRWQNLEFMPFDELSAAQWMRHRHTIAEHFKPPVQPEEKKEEDKPEGKDKKDKKQVADSEHARAPPDKHHKTGSGKRVDPKKGHPRLI